MVMVLSVIGGGDGVSGGGGVDGGDDGDDGEAEAGTEAMTMR